MRGDDGKTVFVAYAEGYEGGAVPRNVAFVPAGKFPDFVLFQFGKTVVLQIAYGVVVRLICRFRLV